MTTRKTQLSILIGTTVVIGLVAAVSYPFSRAASQRHNLMLAREHAEKLIPLFDDDHRFFLVRFSATARGGGTLLVSGQVASDEHLAELRARVEASRPPVGVTWVVDVREPSAEPAESL